MEWGGAMTDRPIDPEELRSAGAERKDADGADAGQAGAGDRPASVEEALEGLKASADGIREMVATGHWAEMAERVHEALPGTQTALAFEEVMARFSAAASVLGERLEEDHRELTRIHQARMREAEAAERATGGAEGLAADG
jgi:hypothetical protein